MTIVRPPLYPPILPYPNVVVQAHYVAVVVLRIVVSKGRRLNRLSRFTTPQLSVVHMAAQLIVFPGRITPQISRERLPISHQAHHKCT